jgi:cellulose synthase operon protein C
LAKFGLSRISSLFRSERNTNAQSAAVSGEGNEVNQTINNFIISDEDGSLARQLVESAQASQNSAGHSSFAVQNPEGDDREEIKRILEYRQIATDGDSSTALGLLQKLTEDVRYKSGYFGFRLHFNIGIIQQDIGEHEAASKSLRLAHSLYPEDNKAQTALAFAELLDGEYGAALDRCCDLLKHDGDHRNLAASILCHAARNLETDVVPEEIIDKELSSPDVFAAYLEYIRDARPDDYHAALTKAFEDNRESKAIRSLWALATLNDAQQNQAFLLGAVMPDGFEDRLAGSAEILKKDLEEALELRPANKLLLPSQANNAAVALRLSGRVSEAAQLIDGTLSKHPDLLGQLAQIRAVLFLQEDNDIQALDLIRPLSDFSELQIMASEIEAKLGDETAAMARIEAVLNNDLPAEHRAVALETKARIAINSMLREVADQAMEELTALFPEKTELLLLRSAYERAFVIQTEKEEFEELPITATPETPDEQKLLDSLKDADNWDFLTILGAADELLARGYFRECSDLLKNRVRFSSESPALNTLCDACLRGHLGSLSKEINEALSESVRNSFFGWRFGANVAILNGEVAKAVPLARKLFEHSAGSISALDWYVQSLLRTNDRGRIQRLIKSLDDATLTGTVSDRFQYVKILVFCGEIERARAFAYRLFCENQNDHRTWMALSASVLAFGRPPGAKDDLEMAIIQEDSTFEIQRPDGTRQAFTLEANDDLFGLREGNIKLDHPVAKAALGKASGEVFDWPLKGNGEARIVYVKHKALAAFHQIIERFEEQFPEASGFKSVSFNFEKDDGLDEMKAMLRERSEYSQQKAQEYSEGSYPIYILGFHLGIDPIDAILGLKYECGIAPKVSSCSHQDQDNAATALAKARENGIIADASACYLIRRLGIERAIEGEFGKIGVTQETIDTFTRRLDDFESSSYPDSETGARKAGNIAVRNGRIVLTEISEDEVKSKMELMRSDLVWLKSECVLVPAVAKADPSDVVRRFRQRDGGRFFDDIFAADGSDRILLSDDYHLRSWAEGIFGVKGAWIQSVLFHLESTGRLETRDVVRCTLHLQGLGEDALSTNADRILTATEMFSEGELSEREFTEFMGLLGQRSADMRSHIEVAVSAIRGLWDIKSLIGEREKATSIILHNLTRFQGSDTKVVLDTVQTLIRDYDIRTYIAGWRIGHFLA